MPDDLDPQPTPPPANPTTLAELLPYLPVSYEYGQQFGMVYSQELADRLEEVQAEEPTQFVAKGVALTDGRYLLTADILSEVPSGLYRVGFSKLDPARFSEIAIMPIADAMALLPVPEPMPE
jgi:hypothetical protein